MHRTFSSKTRKVVYYSSSWHEHILNNTNSFIGETFTNSLILGLVMILSLSIFYSFLQKFRIVKVILVIWYVLQPYLWRRWNLFPIHEKLSHMVLKSSSNYLGGSTRGSKNRISSAEELFDWFPHSTLFAIFISCLSITISGSDLPDRICWCCPGFLTVFNVIVKLSLNDRILTKSFYVFFALCFRPKKSSWTSHGEFLVWLR